MAAYPMIAPTRKSGREAFTLSGRPLSRSLADFWRWSSSSLLDNALRGVLAEYIVAMALGLDHGARSEWADYDLITDDGIKLEIKSAAYIQSWHQSKPSRIQFNIAPTKGWDPKTNKYQKVARRHADVYIFCLLKSKDQATVDPLDLDQWIFCLLASETLNRQKPGQKTITLSSLEKLVPAKVGFRGLKEAVTDIATPFRS